MKVLMVMGKEVLVDDEDYEKSVKLHWYFDDTGYVVNSSHHNGRLRKIRLHRFLLGLGKYAGGPVTDHIDRNKLNNQKSNLRICTQSQNCMNREKHKNNSSGFKGVSKHTNGWAVILYSRGVRMYLGKFKDKIEAAKVYNEAALKHHREFAYLNKV